RLTLPDTGLGAAGTANVGFHESEPNRTLDETAVYVWTFPAAGKPFADSPPRVRVVTDDGRVFVDVQSTLAYQGSWYVNQQIPDSSLRDQIVSAFQAGVVVIEFSSGDHVERVTRVRPDVHFAGRTPVLLCV